MSFLARIELPDDKKLEELLAAYKEAKTALERYLYDSGVSVVLDNKTTSGN